MSDKLASVLDKSEKVKEHVAEAAQDLGAVNAILKSDDVGTIPAQTIGQSTRAEEKVVRAARELHEVNAELEVEVADRAGIESALTDAHAALADAHVELADAHVELADAHDELAEVHDELAVAKAGEADARYRALHDSGTGLPNRDLFFERLDHGLIQAQRHSWGLAVLCVDVDDFKAVNDTHGHHIGDAVLRRIAECLQADVRAEDTVSRFGGDEFMCVLLDVKSKADAEEVARKMAARIAADCPVDGRPIAVHVSVGVAMYPSDATTADALVQLADQSMYRAKRAGPAVAEPGSITT